MLTKAYCNFLTSVSRLCRNFKISFAGEMLISKLERGLKMDYMCLYMSVRACPRNSYTEWFRCVCVVIGDGTSSPSQYSHVSCGNGILVIILSVKKHIYIAAYFSIYMYFYIKCK